MAAPTAVEAAEAVDDNIYCLLVCFDFVVAPGDERIVRTKDTQWRPRRWPLAGAARYIAIRAALAVLSVLVLRLDRWRHRNVSWSCLPTVEEVL